MRSTSPAAGRVVIPTPELEVVARVGLLAPEPDVDGEPRTADDVRQAREVPADEGLREPRPGTGTVVTALPEPAAAGRSELRRIVAELQDARPARRLEPEAS